MKYILDSSAWIEYLNGSSNGQKVYELINNDKDEIFIIPEVISEVIRYVARKKGNKEIAYESIIKNSKIISVTPRIAKDAGSLCIEKNEYQNFPLIDSLIVCSARSINAKIVTKDTHFKPFKNVRFL